MVALQAAEDIWSGTPLSNPANITHRPWKTAGVADQSDVLRNALVLGRSPTTPGPFLFTMEDGTAVVLGDLEPLSVGGFGETQIQNFLAWAPLSPEAAVEPSAHWRLAFFIGAHDDGTVDVTAVEVAPDRASHRSRPRPSLP